MGVESIPEQKTHLKKKYITKRIFTATHENNARSRGGGRAASAHLGFGLAFFFFLNLLKLVCVCVCMCIFIFFLSMINEDFTVVCPMFTLEDINRLELNYLCLLEYHLTVSGQLYAKYYFKLHDVFQSFVESSKQDDPVFTLKALTETEGALLTVITKQKLLCSDFW